MKRKIDKISDAALNRFSVYHRALNGLEREGIKVISSEGLASCLGGTATGQNRYSGAQVRKDLSYVGALGAAGKGYVVNALRDTLAHLLGIDRIWNVALIGAGKLGSALFSYPGFRASGFHISAVLDADAQIIGHDWHGVVVTDVAEIQNVIQQKKIKIAILTLPAEACQGMVDTLVACGICAILNFAPARLVVPAGVELRNADFTGELACLSYSLTNLSAEV